METLEGRVQSIISEYGEAVARQELGDSAVDQALGIERPYIEPCRLGSAALGWSSELTSSFHDWIETAASEDPRTRAALSDVREEIDKIRNAEREEI